MLTFLLIHREGTRYACSHYVRTFWVCGIYLSLVLRLNFVSWLLGSNVGLQQKKLRKKSTTSSYMRDDVPMPKGQFHPPSSLWWRHALTYRRLCSELWPRTRKGHRHIRKALPAMPVVTVATGLSTSTQRASTARPPYTLSFHIAF